tara:strand:- start:322 stop:1239 length:918 start_codon:yes stop_codon:yes gene_type:complete
MSKFLKLSIFEPGVYTVIPTTFINNEVCLKSLFNLINFQINSGIKNIVLLGTTSEAPVLSDEEKELIVTSVWENFSEKLNIIVGIGGNDTAKVVKLGEKFRNYCDGFLVTVPNYNKPTQQGIYKHFSIIAEKLSEKPMMLYNIPSRCGVNMEPIIVSKLFDENDNIMAIKEASGSLSQAIKIKSMCNIKIFSGDDSLAIPLMSIGGSGVVSVASNLIPVEIKKIIDYCMEDFYKKASELFYKYNSLFVLLFVETNPVPLKYLLKRNKLITSQYVRLPLVGLESENKIKLDIISEVLINNEKKIYV